MDPTLSDDGPFCGPEPAEDALAAPCPDACGDEPRGPGDGDATVMAWARAM